MNSGIIVAQCGGKQQSYPPITSLQIEIIDSNGFGHPEEYIDGRVISASEFSPCRIIDCQIASCAKWARLIFVKSQVIRKYRMRNKPYPVYDP
jgi:hypothetical protein